MTVVLAYGSESGDSSDAISFNGTLNAAYTGWVHSGVYSTRLNPVGNAGLLRVYGKAAAGSGADLGLATAYTSCALRVASLPTATIVLCGWVASTGVAICGLELTSAGVLELVYINGSDVRTVIASSASITLNQEYFVELDVLASTTAGGASIACRIDGVAYGSASSLTIRSGTPRTMDRTSHGLSASHTVDWAIDDIVVDNAVAQGECGIEHLLPDGQTSGNWNEGTGTTQAEVDDYPGHDIDTTYLAESGASTVHYLTMQPTSAAVQDGYILALMAGVVVRDVSGTSNCRFRIRSPLASTPEVQTTAGDPGPTYVLRKLISLTDPVSTVAWTKAGADGALVALVTGATTTVVRVTAVWLDVLYQIPPAASGGIVPRAMNSYRTRRVA